MLSVAVILLFFAVENQRRRLAVGVKIVVNAGGGSSRSGRSTSFSVARRSTTQKQQQMLHQQASWAKFFYPVSSKNWRNSRIRSTTMFVRCRDEEWSKGGRELEQQQQEEEAEILMNSRSYFDPEMEPEQQPTRRRKKKTLIPNPSPPSVPSQPSNPSSPEPAPVEIDLPGRKQQEEGIPDDGLPTTIPREGDDPDLYDRDRLLKRLRNQGNEYPELIESSRENSTIADNVTISSNLTQLLLELETIMEGDPRNIVILGTRHCNLLHQRIIELVSFALVLTGNHVYTSGGMGTNYVAMRGALRAENDTASDIDSRLSVILPQRIEDQPLEVQEVLKKVKNVTELKRNDLPLDKASRLCNTKLIEGASELIVFAYHDSWTVLDCAAEARRKDKLVTLMYLD